MYLIICLFLLFHNLDWKYFLERAADIAPYLSGQVELIKSNDRFI